MINALNIQSLRRIAGEAKQIENLQFAPSARAESRFREIYDVLTAFERMKVGLRSFGKFVPDRLVQILLANHVEPQLGAESRELSIFFSDIRSFAAISEALGASRLAEKLGAYLSTFTRIIQGPDSNGIVDKYVGDSVMAFWNAPEPVTDHAYRAC